MTFRSIPLLLGGDFVQYAWKERKARGKASETLPWPGLRVKAVRKGCAAERTKLTQHDQRPFEVNLRTTDLRAISTLGQGFTSNPGVHAAYSTLRV